MKDKWDKAVDLIGMIAMLLCAIGLLGVVFAMLVGCGIIKL